MARNEGHTVAYRRGDRRSMVDMLKTGMCGSIGRDHRRILARLLYFFWSRSGLIFIVIVIALPRKILWSFVLMGRATLERNRAVSKGQ